MGYNSGDHIKKLGKHQVKVKYKIKFFKNNSIINMYNIPFFVFNLTVYQDLGTKDQTCYR